MNMEMSPEIAIWKMIDTNYDLVNLQSNRSNNLYTLGVLNSEHLNSLNNLIN